MKRLLFLIALVCATTAFAQEKEAKKIAPPAGKALVGDFYGSDVKNKAIKKALSVAQLNKELDKSTKVEHAVLTGKVTSVCPKKGCWLTVENDKNETFFVKMKDYAFFVPVALEGKNVVLEGVAERKMLSVEEARHYAEDAKKSQEEIDAITEPQEQNRFMASGIKVVK